VVFSFFTNTERAEWLSPVRCYRRYPVGNWVSSHCQTTNGIYTFDFTKDDVGDQFDSFRVTSGLFAVNEPVARAARLQDKVASTYRVSKEMIFQIFPGWV
jgi:hypothetical protein